MLEEIEWAEEMAEPIEAPHVDAWTVLGIE